MPTFNTAAAYAADARARATAAGAPIRRTDFRSLMLEPSDFIFLSRGDVMIADRRCAPRPLEAEDLEEFIDYENVKGVEPLTWLVADRKTRYQLWELSKELGVQAHRPFSYQIESLTKIESQRLPVLTDALTRKLWAPESVDTTSLASWCSALGIAASSTRTMMIEAADKAATRSTGGPVAAYAYNQAATAARSERRLMQSFGYSGTSSSVDSLMLLSQHSDLTGGIAAMDPGLAEMNRISGVTCSLTVDEVDVDLVTGEVSMPMKFKQDRPVRVISPTGVAEGRIVDLFATGTDGLAVTMKMTSQARARTSVAAGETVHLTSTVFTTRRARVENRRWMGHEKIEKVPRQMPLAVRAAAATETRPHRSRSGAAATS